MCVCIYIYIYIAPISGSAVVLVGRPCRAASWSRELGSYMLNTRNEETNTVFYSCLACFVNTLSSNMYVSMSYTG